MAVDHSRVTSNIGGKHHGGTVVVACYVCNHFSRRVGYLVQHHTKFELPLGHHQPMAFVGIGLNSALYDEVDADQETIEMSKRGLWLVWQHLLRQGNIVPIS